MLIEAMLSNDVLVSMFLVLQYLDLLAALVDVQCEAIDEICKDAKDLQLTEPEDFITKRRVYRICVRYIICHP